MAEAQKPMLEDHLAEAQRYLEMPTEGAAEGTAVALHAIAHALLATACAHADLLYAEMRRQVNEGIIDPATFR